MKKRAFVVFILFLAYGTAISQSCLPEGITLTTQEQIDNFQTNHPGCIEIEGGVMIEGDDITNLSGLSVVTSIEGDLNIEYNATLTSLSGLDNVTSIGGNLWFLMNSILTSLTGLDNLTSIGGELIFVNNAALPSLTGLDNITSIGGELYIDNNDALTSLTGLDNLTSIGGAVIIFSNTALTSLTGLDNITSISGSLRIAYCTTLTSLTGLDNIDAASIDSLFIYKNSSLYTCEVQSICDYLISPTGTIEIYDNAPGCDSQEEVEDACEGVSIQNINPKNAVSIFPNPTNNQLSLTCKNGRIEEVIIYNQTGQTVFHSKHVCNIIDISELQPGMYIVEVVSGQIKIREKLMVE